ncbi:amino acid racemase [Limosilactobacillus gastricus]|uniref:Aspartate racemase n=1 Tax=Limosilactobacillus gastricus DSM 16045 TaxID=1423749 RepID=A0A0R1V734_9LACO|nr:amino acid racemase [Limosilactobacillus gastricus]KRM01345.1 Aspartate racemase [Limosilactobacillus gastricus DSM 16045]QGF40953.1 amino acid racemase [Limosilactobacillus gastricus]
MQKFFTVLGGMGTLATESFVRVMDQRTPIHCDQDYLDYLVVNHATVPDRTNWILDHRQPSIVPPLLEDIQQQSLLKPSFFVLACNTAHYVYDQLQAATEIPIINMLAETVAEVSKIMPQAKRVGILATPGTIQSGLYDPYIKKAGYEVVRPTKEILALTEDLIYNDIKEAGHSDNQKYHQLVKQMIEDLNCDIVILGCTELSYAEEMDPETTYPVADSQSIVVDRTIEKALSIRQAD